MKGKEKKSNSVQNVLLHKIIELGGGRNPLYHPNFDAVNGDIICDLREGIPLPDRSVLKIFSQDFFEHLTIDEAVKLLAECMRVLIPQGGIEFIVPDIELMVSTICKWNEHADNLIFGAQHDAFDIHKMWYSKELMRYILGKEGWTVISIKSYKKDDNWLLEPKFTVEAKS